MMYSYLALGDSYTVGEQVCLSETFPYQTCQLLRKSGFKIYAPEIIAKTGWTTDELSTAIEATLTLKRYNLVTLLIGVNNQYRGRSVNEFEIQFNGLLKRAIELAADNPKHVFVLSIPDWSITPFASDRNIKEIATAINEYNKVCKNAAEQSGAYFIDITVSQRENGNNPDFLASDGLHPSAREYAKWATKLSEAIIKVFAPNRDD